MENLDKNNKRKRHSSTQKSPDDNAGKKKLIRSKSLQSLPSSDPSKLVDQLFQTWKNAIESTSHAVSTQKEQLSQASKSSTSKLATLNLKKISLDSKLSDLRKEKLKYCRAQMEIDRKHKFDAVMLNGAWEIVHFIYENIKYMLEKEAPFDQHLSEAAEIRSEIIRNLQEKTDKFVAIPDEAEYLNTEINKEKSELEEFKNTSRKQKEEIEKLKNSVQEVSLDDLKQDLHNTKEYIDKLIEEEIGLESDLQKKNDQNMEHDCEYSQNLQESDKEFNDLETELKNYDAVEGIMVAVGTKMKEIVSGNLCLDYSIQVEYAEEIQQVKNNIKDLELKAHLEKQRIQSANCLPVLELELIEVKKKIDLSSLQTIDLKNLDDSLMEVNKKLENLETEQTTEEIKLRNEELQDLIHQEEVLIQESVEVERNLNEYSNCKEEEQLIYDLKVELTNKTKSHNEKMENYKKTKEGNSEHFEKNPTLLEPKDYTDFEEMKKKAQATLVSAQKRASNLDKKNELKLKELERKAEKYRAFMKEIEQELKTGEKTFTPLEKEIKDAKEQLEKKKEALQKKETFLKQKALQKKETLQKKEALQEKETLLKKEALQEKETLLKKEALQEKETLQKKESLQKKTLPMITKNEPVKIDMEALSWIKSLSQSLQKNTSISSLANDKTSDETLSHSQNVNKNSFLSQKKSTEDEFSFSETEIDTEKSSQKMFHELLSQYGSQKSQKSAPSPSKTQINQEKSRVEDKSEQKENQKLLENKFFKSPSRSLTTKIHRRSKSVPPKKF